MKRRDRYSDSSSSSRQSSPCPPRRRRSSSPESRHETKVRSSRALPEAFGSVQKPRRPDDDNINILQRMKTHYESSPLADLYNCIVKKQKIKIWTRNDKEVRGVMTGYLIAFDKHWNMVLRDVDEVYLKPKKCKTPFLGSVSSYSIFQEMPAKMPPVKGNAVPAAPPKPKEGGKKTKRGRKKKSISAKRYVDKLFIRGDNIALVRPMNEVTVKEDEEETSSRKHK